MNKYLIKHKEFMAIDEGCFHCDYRDCENCKLVSEGTRLKNIKENKKIYMENKIESQKHLENEFTLRRLFNKYKKPNVLVDKKELLLMNKLKSYGMAGSNLTDEEFSRIINLRDIVDKEINKIKPHPTKI